MAEYLVGSSGDGMALAGMSDFVERATEYTTRWSLSKHQSWQQKDLLFLQRLRWGQAIHFFIHLLDSYPAARKTRMRITSPQPQIGTDAKWIGNHKIERDMALRTEGDGGGGEGSGGCLPHPTYLLSHHLGRKSKEKR